MTFFTPARRSAISSVVGSGVRAWSHLFLMSARCCTKRHTAMSRTPAVLSASLKSAIVGFFLLNLILWSSQTWDKYFSRTTPASAPAALILSDKVRQIFYDCVGLIPVSLFEGRSIFLGKASELHRQPQPLTLLHELRKIFSKALQGGCHTLLQFSFESSVED